MPNRPIPTFRVLEEPLLLVGTMNIYSSQSEASSLIPQQWRDFLLNDYPALRKHSNLAKCYGASPCTDDRRIHYLTGVAVEQHPEAIPATQHRLTLEAGEYAFVLVEDITSLRNTWIWLLSEWLPASGRLEKHAPEFERFTQLSQGEGEDAPKPIGPVEIWIPLEEN